MSSRSQQTFSAKRFSVKRLFSTALFSQVTFFFQVHERATEGAPEGADDDNTPSPAGDERGKKDPASGLAPEKGPTSGPGGADGPALGVGGEKGPASCLGGGEGPASGLSSGVRGGRVSGRRAPPGEEVGPLNSTLDPHPQNPNDPGPSTLHPKT